MMKNRKQLMVVFGALLALGGCGGEAVYEETTREAQACRGAPYPIVLAHGLAGFERFGPINYFFKVGADLRARGEKVVEAEVSPYEYSAVRAQQLASFVDRARSQYGACKVNIIAHSQGGIDARYLISSLGYGDRVASLITVSTPHRGAPVADIVGGLLPGYADGTINLILKAIQGLTSDAPGNPSVRNALTQLTTTYMNNTFNPRNPNDSRVRYYSVAGRSGLKTGSTVCSGGRWANSGRVDASDLLLTPTESITALTYGGTLLNPVVNDGLVSVSSAKWGTFLGCIPGDHFDEIGQIADLGTDLLSGFNHINFYRQLVSTLHTDGF